MSRKCMGMAVTRRNCMIGYVPPLHVDDCENIDEMEIQNVRKCQGMGGACGIQSTSERMTMHEITGEKVA